MRNAFAETFYEAAKRDERLAMVVADISAAGSMESFRRDYPKRFVNTGVAEQIMIGMCAGMAMRGLRPFAYTIATFALFRPYEFIRCDLAYQNLPVTVVGVGGGVTYSQLGGTHHAMEDVAVACSMPNMRVIAPCDPYETQMATRWCTQNEGGPVYLRLGKAGEPTFTSLHPWEFGKVRQLYAGENYGDGTCVLGYGPILAMACEAYPKATVYSCHTLKPLDRFGIAKLFAFFKRIVVLEESVPYLGPIVKSLAWEHDAHCDIQCLSLKNEFTHVYGSHADVLAAHGITKEALRERI